jgi:pimeloyl-ACP methyl ester carboxylesterase
MSRLLRLALIAGLLVALAPALPAAAQSPLPPPLDQCASGQQTSGAVFFMCVPPSWNGDLIVFAHGYVAPNESQLKFLEQLVLSDGNTIPGLVLSLNYAFATTSYSRNGLAVLEGIDDVRDLISLFKTQFPTTNHVYLIGASEGGLVTTLALEQYPQDFSGGLAMCGPIGNFRSQINYWGDFRVLFDYFFPAYRIPFSPVNIDEANVWPNWEAIAQAIGAAVAANPSAAGQLLRTSHAPIDPADPASAISTTVGILDYNVFATNDGRAQLNGQPYDNRYRWYSGSNDDWRLNRTVERFTADRTALQTISQFYETSGRLTKPLVTLHTTGDPIVPYWHETLYRVKVLFKGSLNQYVGIPIIRYGHCSFKSSEALVAFGVLVFKATGRLPAGLLQAVPGSAEQMELRRLTQLPVAPKAPTQ